MAHPRVHPRHPRGLDGISGYRPPVRVDAEARADPLAKRVPAARSLGGEVRLEKVPDGDTLGGEDPPGRLIVEPRLRDVERVELRPGALEHDETEHREVEIVVFGDARDVLGEARGPAGAIPGPTLRHVVGKALRREPAADGPVAGCLGDRADAFARDRLDRLSEHAAGRAAEPRALDPVCEVGARLRGRGKVGEREDPGELLGLVVGERPRERLELVEQLERQGAELGRDRPRRGAP